MKRLILFLLMILLIGCHQEISENNEYVPITTSEDEVTEKVKENIQIIEVQAPVFSEAKENSSIVHTVYLGSVYKIMDVKTVGDNTWFRIEVDSGLRGWISDAFCEESDFEPFVYKEGECKELEISKYFYMKDSISKYNLLNNQDGYDLYVDDEIVLYTYDFEDYGTHEVYAVNKKNPNEKTIVYKVEVVSRNAYDILRHEYHENSKSFDIIERTQVNEDNITAVYLLKDPQPVIWYEIEKNGVKGYVKERKTYTSFTFDEVNVVCDNLILTVEEKNISPSTELFLERYLTINGSKYIVVNEKNGETLEVDFVYRLLEDGKTMLTYPFLNAYDDRGVFLPEEQPYTIKVIDLEKGNFDVLLEYENIGSGINTSYDNGTSNVFKYLIINRISDDAWSYADDRYYHDIYYLKKKENRWTLGLEKSEFQSYTHEMIDFYNNFLDLESKKGTFSRPEYASLTFKNVYDIIDGEYVLWFDAILEDGTKGYAFRPLRESEKEAYIIVSQVNLVLGDGSLYTVNRDESEYYSWSRLISGMETIDTYMVDQYYDGAFTTMIPKYKPEAVSYDLESSFKSTPNQHYLIGKSYNYEINEGETLKIYDLSSGIKKEVFKFSSAGYWIRSLNVVDDSTITFFLIDFGKKIPVIIKLIDDQWEIVNDVKLD